MSIPHKIKLFLSGTLILFFYNTINAQEDGYSLVTADFETWSKVGLNYKFNKKLGVSFEQGLRLRQNSTLTDQVFTNIGFFYKPIKSLKFGVDFRYIYDRGQNLEFDNDFRFNLDANYKHKINRFSFAYRLRFQTRNEIGYSSDEGDVFKNYLRLRARLKYNINNWKMDPYISGEVFRDLTRYTGSFDTFRFTLGTSYQFKKIGELGGFYRIERELGVNYPKTTYIIGLNYTINLKNK